MEMRMEMRAVRKSSGWKTFSCFIFLNTKSLLYDQVFSQSKLVKCNTSLIYQILNIYWTEPIPKESAKCNTSHVEPVSVSKLLYSNVFYVLSKAVPMAIKSVLFYAIAVSAI